MAQEEMKENLLHPEQWLRMLFMLGYLFVVWVVGLVLLVVIITQTLTVLFTGLTNSHLRHFGILVTIYLFQIVDFLVYGTEQKPFPFKPFPDLRVVPPGSAPGPATHTAPHRPMPDEPAESVAPAPQAGTSPIPPSPSTPASAAPSPPPTAPIVPPVASAGQSASETMPDPYADLDSDPGMMAGNEPGIVPDAESDDTKRI